MNTDMGYFSLTRFRAVLRKRGINFLICVSLVTLILAVHNLRIEEVRASLNKRDVPVPVTSLAVGDVQNVDVKHTDVTNVKDPELEAVKKQGTLNFPPKKPIKPYHGHDFLKDKPFQFDQRFKNPCWYEGKRLRCLPYFLLLGVRKCATTSLYSNIIQHPDAISAVTKEPQFFGYGQMYNQTEGADRIDNYIKIFDSGTRKIVAEVKASDNKEFYNNKILGDGSTDSMYVNYDWHQYPGNKNRKEPKYLALDYLHHFIPKAKVIVVFRDPVERLYSEYVFIHEKLFKQNNTNPYSFHLCVEHLLGLYKDCFKHNTVRACVYNTTIQHNIEPSMILNLGIYYVYMEDILRIFGKDQVLVLHLEDVSEGQGLENVFKFLDMEKLPVGKLEKIAGRRMLNTRQSKTGDSDTMLKATRRLLQDFYKPFNERMAKLMNDKYFLYQTN